MTATDQINDLIANTPDARGAIIARVRQLIHEADPEVIEAWKWLGSPVFEHAGIVCVVTLLKNKVKVTFNDGARLPDPDKVFNAGLGGGKWRAIDIGEGDALDEAAFKALFRAGVEYNVAKADFAAKAKKARKQGAQ